MAVPCLSYHHERMVIKSDENAAPFWGAAHIKGDPISGHSTSIQSSARKSSSVNVYGVIGPAESHIAKQYPSFLRYWSLHPFLLIGTPSSGMSESLYVGGSTLWKRSWNISSVNTFTVPSPKRHAHIPMLMRTPVEFFTLPSSVMVNPNLLATSALFCSVNCTASMPLALLSYADICPILYHALSIVDRDYIVYVILQSS